MLTAQYIGDPCRISDDVTTCAVAERPHHDQMHIHKVSRYSDGKGRGVEQEVAEQHGGLRRDQYGGVFYAIHKIAPIKAGIL